MGDTCNLVSLKILKDFLYIFHGKIHPKVMAHIDLNKIESTWGYLSTSSGFIGQMVSVSTALEQRIRDRTNKIKQSRTGK